MKKIIVFISILLCLLLCSCMRLPQNPGENSPSPVISPSPTPIPPAPRVLSIGLEADPPCALSDSTDPYSRLNPYTSEIYQPDRELYNALYRAALAHESSLDISGYALSEKEKRGSAESLYSPCGYELFPLDRVKLSKDGDTVHFRYIDMDEKEIATNRETLFARMSHLLNNVAKSGYSDMQKLIAVYKFLGENSSYSSDMSDYLTYAPYGILVRNQGICGGYAELMRYALTELGLSIEYACTEAHAWNIVKFGENYYHTDATWGAGMQWDMRTSYRTLFMDDASRIQGLMDTGFYTAPMILGYPAAEPKAPPACTSTDLNAYAECLSVAFDIETNTAYISDYENIDRMDLDCTNRQTVLQGEAALAMAYFNHALYYVSANDGFLYRLGKDKKKELLDYSGQFFYMQMQGSNLFYGADASGENWKRMLLLVPEEIQTATMLQKTEVRRSRSFSIRIEFSQPMHKAQNWNNAVYLLDDANNAIPCSFSYDMVDNSLTIRPLSYTDEFASVTVYATTKATAQSGVALNECTGMRVLIASEANAQGTAPTQETD